MQTKQQRLRYGEDLRREIQMREEKKKAETMQRRGLTQPKPNDSFTMQSNPTVVNSALPRNPIVQNVPFSAQTGGRKEQYQRQLEGQGYFPFGKSGGGAPNRKNQTRQHPVESQDVYQNDHGLYAQQQPISQPSGYSITNQGYPQQSQPQQYYPPSYINQNYGIQQQGYQPPQRQSIPQAIITPQQYMQPQIMNPVHSQNYPPQYYQPSVLTEHPSLGQIQQQEDYYLPKESVIRQESRDDNRRSQRQPRSQQEMPMDQKVKMLKGHNILQYENLQPGEQDSRQQKKESNQRELLKQIEQKQRLKKQEEEKRKQQELKLQEENKKYIEMENRKIQEDIDKKKREELAKKESDQSNRLARERMDLQAQDAKKRKRMDMQQHQQPIEPKQRIYQEEQKPISNQRLTRNKFEQQEEIDYQTIEKTFDVGISKEFIHQQKFRDQERRTKDKQLSELKKNVKNMKDEVSSQNQVYKIEMERAKLEIQRAKLEKDRIEQEVIRLKQELNNRNHEDNYRLQRAMQKTEPMDAPSPKPLRPKGQEVFVKKTYTYQTRQPQPRPEYVLKSMEDPNNGTMFEQGLQSLVGETVRIPVGLNSDKLTMSNIGDFDIRNQRKPEPKESQFKSRPQQFSNVQEQDSVRREYRKHLGDQDQLDRFTKHPTKPVKKWGQMSSIDQSGTQQIQRLLKEQHQQVQRQMPKRPGSKLSNLGKQSLGGNVGYVADGFTLQSNDGTYRDCTFKSPNQGTLNLLKINQNNDRRLSRLRQMGVESVPQYGGDQELGQLDKLLEKYDR